MSILKGIDISHHQGNIDASAVKKSGLVDFAIIREGYRNQMDRCFMKNVKEFTEAGIPIFGSYHFIYAVNEGEMKEEIASFLSNMEKVGLGNVGTDFYVFADYEYDTIKKASEKGITLTKEDCNKLTCQFLDGISHKYKPGIYTNLDFYKNYYTKETLSKYDIWLADYTGGPDFDCVFQQYSSTGSIPGISGNVDLNYYYGKEIKKPVEPIRLRSEVVELAKSWLGKNELDGSYKEIIDVYNSFEGSFPRGTKVDYSWSWCACFWSAIAVKLGYTDIMPIEISCGYLIEEAKKMEIWIENDAYIPKPGDAVLYDWDDNGVGDNVGWPDHVGVVVDVQNDAGTFAVIEGNKSDKVDYRYMDINGKFIRGFIAPKYQDGLISGKNIDDIVFEVLKGDWGNGEERKRLLESYGYNYETIQKAVNEYYNNLKALPQIYSFGTVLECLKKGLSIRRKIWPEELRLILKENHNECLLEDNETLFSIEKLIYIIFEGRAKIWVPTFTDLFAEDWEVAIVLNS